MTSPVSSNSGFSTLVELATALSGTGKALSTDDLASVRGQLKSFATGQKLNSGSSGWLMDAFKKNPSKVDGVFNYRSMIESSSTPLTVITPSDGVITADYRLSLIAGKSQEVNANYKKLVDWLLKDSTQRLIAKDTHRFTTTTDASANTAFELQFPSTMATVKSLLKEYVSEVRKPANMVFQIDTSGSMSGQRLSDLQTALGVLSGSTAKTDNDSLFAVQPHESMTFINFASDIKNVKTFTMGDDEASTKQQMKGISSYVNSLNADGGTAIYSTLEESLTKAAESSTKDNVTSVVLFTDGQNTNGIGYQEFNEWYSSHTDVHSIPIYTIVFGDADASQLQAISTASNGKSFNATTGSLSSVFKEIRGYL
jgi:Ca-activated chloride channel family protein